MPPKSMSVIFILFTKGFILGILGCADGEVCSFRLLRVPAYKVPAVCKAGVFYFFIKAVSVITVLVQEGAREQKYRVSTVHGKIYAAIHTYAVGDLGGKLVGVLRIRPVPPKKLLFSVLRTLAGT
ncbi:MAG: hypothetical protein HDT44_01145 [Ruminococcaceae bacterium]|nr:hypothetical protein [Oscillospiraceae bacterium]